MSMKDLPKDARIDELVELAIATAQTAMVRVYEIVELEKRPLNEIECISIAAMDVFFGRAKSDLIKLKKKSLN